MSNAQDRLDRANDFAQKVIEYRNVCNQNGDSFGFGMTEEAMWKNAIFHVYLESKCADCGHSPCGRPLGLDEPKR
jgi:hypothetical protein